MSVSLSRKTLEERQYVTPGKGEGFDTGKNGTGLVSFKANASESYICHQYSMLG